MPRNNAVIRFVSRPAGRPAAGHFRLEQVALRDLEPGEYLVRNLYLSMDPALVGRMRGEANYAESVEPGEVMHCYGVGQVVRSRHPRVAVGELRLGRFDMQQLCICDDRRESNRILPGLAPVSQFLSVVGVTGATAYFALFDICRPQSGETVVISAAGSSVGTIAAQLAQRAGCRTVGIVSTPDKAADVGARWGYDAVVSYRGKTIDALAADLAAACPAGVDAYFDNTGGDISEALLDLYNDHARVAVVGRLALSHLADTRHDVGRRDTNVTLTRRVRKQGFVLFDYRDRIPAAILRLGKLVRQGHLRAEEDVVHGIEAAPGALLRMLDGGNRGKQLVHLADVDEAIVRPRPWLGRALTSDAFPTRLVSWAIERRARPS